jgi:hypothetical protein
MIAVRLAVLAGALLVLSSLANAQEVSAQDFANEPASAVPS